MDKLTEQDAALVDRLVTICWEKGGMTSPVFANLCAQLLQKLQRIVGVVPAPEDKK